MTCSDDNISRERSARRRRAVGAALEAIEADGLPGLTRTMYRMIGENQPSIDCLREAEQPFGADAPSGDETGAGQIFGNESWDAAVDMAKCLRGAKADPEPPPPPPEDPPPQPDPPRDFGDSVADIVLAALLVRLRDEGRGKRGSRD